MKLSLVISTYNRTKLFDYVLRSLVYQTFPKDEMEIVVVDDGSTEDTLGLLKKWQPFVGCQIKYIRIDSSKYTYIPIKYHTPALTNNIGFKKSEGDVVVVHGNDVMHLGRDNLILGYNHALENKSVFGTVWECDKEFINYLDTNPEWKRYNDLMPLYNHPHAKINNIHMTGWYWYVLFVKRSFVFKINGVDEEYLRGVYAEDNNFEQRLLMAGTKHFREPRIITVHLWHYDEGETIPKQARWGSGTWEEAAEINRTRWRKWNANRTMVANRGREWGDEKVIVQEEIL